MTFEIFNKLLMLEFYFKIYEGLIEDIKKNLVEWDNFIKSEDYIVRCIYI